VPGRSAWAWAGLSRWRARSPTLLAYSPPKGGAQLREIHDYIARDNREAARRTVRGIFDRAKAYLPEGIGKVTQYSLLTSGDCRQLP